MTIKNIYTDAIKEVIGNDPVLDQFDTFYDASFYGTGQDDYITGSILLVKKNNENSYDLITGSRGKSFSKYYAFEEYEDSSLNDNITPSTPGEPSYMTLAEPLLSNRLKPWNEKVSHSFYRYSQHVCVHERIFDSCIPELSNCFNEKSGTFWVSVDPETGYVNQDGNLLFNFYDNLSTEYLGEQRLFSNNEWTWSFPYEDKYLPEKRVLNTSKNLGIDSTKYGMIKFQTSSFEIDYSNDLSVFVKGDVNGIIPTSIKNLFSYFPGYEPEDKIPSESNNNFSTRIKDKNYSTGLTQFKSWLFKEVRLTSGLCDIVEGGKYSIFSPVDIDLSKTIQPSNLNYLTSSLSSEDTLKVLFGFGDVNNMTYGYRRFNKNFSDNYQTLFELTDNQSFIDSISDESYPTSIPVNSSGFNINETGFIADFTNSPLPGPNPGEQGWAVHPRSIYDHENDEIWQFEGNYWRHLSGTYTINGTQLSGNPNALIGDYTVESGVFWPVEWESNYIARSSTRENGMGLENGSAVSILSIDVTSSYPWSFEINRAVTGYSGSTFLLTYFSSVPGVQTPIQPENSFIKNYDQLSLTDNIIFSKLLTGDNQIVALLDSLTGNAKIIDGNTVIEPAFLNKYSSTDENKLPFSPGQWRLNFAFVNAKWGDDAESIFRLPNPPSDPPCVSFAAIDNIIFCTYKNPDVFPPSYASQTIGGNNYPRFRKRFSDIT